MSTQTTLPFKLADPNLFHNQSYVHGKWVDSSDGKRFEVIDPGSGQPWTTVANNSAADVDAVVQSSYEAFQTYSKVNPRQRAQMLYRWDSLIRDSRDDLAKILTYETGKPLAEAYGEIDYALGFTWWFAGEAECV